MIDHHDFKNTTFNFLASLINGNIAWRMQIVVSSGAFNFLASLINGNSCPVNSRRIVAISSFNFLASLINGNAT